MKVSAKHVLATNTDKLKLVDKFYEYFEIYDGFRIVIKQDIIDVNVLDLMINIHELEKDDIESDDMINNEWCKCIYVKNTETGEVFVIKDEAGSSFYIGEFIFNTMSTNRRKGIIDDEGFIHIPLKSIIPTDYRDIAEDDTVVDSEESDNDDDESEDVSPVDDVFFVRLPNAELTKPLKALKSFIEKGKILEADNVSDFITNTREMMALGNINIESVHIEIMLRNLIRRKDDETKIPDWSKPEVQYDITSIHNGILKSNSLLNAITFERLHAQLKSPSTYYKTGTSQVDQFFLR